MDVHHVVLWMLAVALVPAIVAAWVLMWGALVEMVREAREDREGRSR